MAEYVAGLSYDVLNVLEDAALLRCDPKTLKIKAAEWDVPHRRQGSRLRFSKQQLLEWIQGRETNSSPKLVPIKATA
jgi:hypothetical protein